METNRYHNPDGLTACELGWAELASGNFAVVETNGEVSLIVDREDWLFSADLRRAVESVEL